MNTKTKQMLSLASLRRLECIRKKSQVCIIAGLLVFMHGYALPISTANPTQEEQILSKEERLQKQVDKLKQIRQEKEKLKSYESEVEDMAQSKLELGALAADQEKKIQKHKQNIQKISDMVADLQVKEDEINNQMAKIEAKMKRVEESMWLTRQNIKEKKQELEEQKEIIHRILAHLNSQDRQSVVEVLLRNETLGDAMREVQHLTAVEKEAQNIFRILKETQDALEAEEKRLSQKHKKQVVLQGELSEKKQALQENLDAQKRLLAFNKEQKETYQELLTQTKRAQEELSEKMQNMKVSISSLSQKLDKAEAKMLENSNASAKNITFDWPVSPTRGITAYFNDPFYYRKWGYQHKALDVRISQGTPIKAPANAYVYEVNNNGYGYSTLVLAHSDRVFTVFGHVWKFHVKEGDVVKRGDIVAYSGGGIGTKGAGFYTTGPHTHFEIWEDGKAKNPLGYLDLRKLDVTHVPGKYLPRLAKQLDEGR